MFAAAHHHVVANVDIRQRGELQHERPGAPNDDGGARSEANRLTCSSKREYAWG